VVAVGDSFTFGQCVDDDETYPAAIEEALGIEALNLGVMGYGHDQALLRLRRDGFPYKPDAVVFGFHHTDRRRNLLWFRGYSKPRFVFDEAGELVLDNVPTALPQDFLGLWPPRVWNLIQIARAKRTVDDRTRMRDANKLSKAILNQMAIDVQAQGIPLLVVFLPNMGALESDHEFGWKWLEKLCLATNKPAPFECVSPAPRLRQIAPKPAQMRKHLDCHYSPRFQREIGIVAAEKLAAMLGIQAPAAATEPAAPERPRKQRKKRRRRS
jgi:hypothetical protein